VKADNAVRPSQLTNDFRALRFVEQGRQLDQHGSRSLPHRERPTDQRPDPNQHAEILPRADGSLPGQGLFITPEPDKSHGQLALGHAWLELGERQKAITALHRCLDAGPADPSAVQALIDRIEGDPTETMSQAYVRALFDRYAERFDEDLTIRLKYQAPQVLRTMVDQIRGGGADKPALLDILDVGCGTGLAGVAFRSLAGRLHGSDLAPRMVEKARQRGVYDYLEVADLGEGIARTLAAWDLVVAADVLVYVGDLAPAMRAAALGLRPGGLFCASVEQGVEKGGGDGFALGPARRYTHSPAYIRRTAAEAGLDLIVLEEAIPRWEKGQPVSGLVFAARRP
jgi:predicted TPR repeat methyltransferase